MKTDEEVLAQLLAKEAIYLARDLQVTGRLNGYTGMVEFSDKDCKGDLAKIPLIPSNWLSEKELEGLREEKETI